MFIPHVFQQVTFSLVFKVQSGHLVCVCVLQLLRHFDLDREEGNLDPGTLNLSIIP